MASKETKEVFEPGDNIKVPDCQKNVVFCVVSPAIKNRRERGDDGVPLNGPSCGCVRAANQVEKIPSELP